MGSEEAMKVIVAMIFIAFVFFAFGRYSPRRRG